MAIDDIYLLSTIRVTVATNFALRDLREAATKLLHRVTIERDNSEDGYQLDKNSLRNLMGPAIIWSQTCRSILIPFFEQGWKTAFKKNNRNIRVHKDLEWVSKLDDLIEEAEGGKKPSLWMVPFNGGSGFGKDIEPYFKYDSDTREKRLVAFLELSHDYKTAHFDEILEIVRLEKDMFQFLLETNKNRIVFRLKNISHVVDANGINPDSNSNQKSLRKDLEVLLTDEEFESQLMSVSKLMIFMHILSEFKDSSNDESISLSERLREEVERYHTAVSDHANVSRTKGLIRRIDSMKWGPNNFIRDDSVIEEAVTRLDDYGLLTLTGVGALGKTALAVKLLQKAALDDNFDRYVTMSTKVNSDQGELNPDTGGITRTNRKNSMFFSLLNAENKRISGSMSRLCRSIIKAVKSDWKYADEHVEDLMNEAIHVMEENSMLIVIDNFEDIEEPSDHLTETDSGRMLLSDVNREYKHFQEFFKLWSLAYKKSNKQDSLEQSKKRTQVIITTRGKGTYQQNHPMPVPPLTIEENFQLFEEKIQARFKDDLLEMTILTTIREKKEQIIAEFGNWELPKNKHHHVNLGYVHPPAYTIFAAAAIKELKGKYGIFEQIKEWNPNGKSAEFIRKYVTSKIFGGLNEIEIGVMGHLLTLGMDSSFDTTIIRQAVEEQKQEWDFEQANRFLRDFAQHRDFFTETNLSSYKWNRFYLREVRDHFQEKYPDRYYAPSGNDEEIRYESPEETVPEIRTEERGLLQRYLSHENLDVNLSTKPDRTFNSVIVEVLKEGTCLDERNAAQALIMLIGNTKLNASKDLINNLFPAKNPAYCLFDKFRNAKKLAPAGSGNAKQKNKMVEVNSGFIKANFKHVWKFFQNVLEGIVEILTESNEHNLIIRFYRILQSETESCYEKGLISKPLLLEFYNRALFHFNQISSSDYAIFEKDLFEDISGNILKEYLYQLAVLPRDISEDLTREQTEVEHYDRILVFVDRNIQLTGTQEQLLGPLYWLALRRVASETKGATLHDNHSLLAKIDEWFIYGARSVKATLTENVVRQKKESVLKNFEQLIWSIDELVKPSNRRFGGLTGKLVLHKYGDSISSNQTVKIPRGSPSDSAGYIGDEILNQLRGKRYPYRIGVINTSFIYLEPVIIDGQLVKDYSNLMELKTCNDRILKSHEKNRGTRITLWNEYKKTIPFYDVLPEFSSKKVKEQIEFYKSIISDSKIPFDHREIQGRFYVKPGVISSEDEKGVVVYPYEKRFDNSCLKLITNLRKQDQGLALPRNPKTLSKMINTFFACLGNTSQITYSQMEKHLEKEYGDKEHSYHLVYRAFKTTRVYDKNWRALPIPKGKFTEKSKTWSDIRGQIWYLSKIMIEKHGAPREFGDALFEYCTAVQASL